MKNIALFIVFTGLILSTNAQEYDDTVKLKAIKTNYAYVDYPDVKEFGDLNGVTINVDTLPAIYPEIVLTNISNDTYSSNVKYLFIIECLVYADTGLLLRESMTSPEINAFPDFFPNATMAFGGFRLDIMNPFGINIEQISHIELIFGVAGTSKDGIYSERVFYEGANTSVFYIVRGGVGVQEIEQKAGVVSVYPNPAITQLHVERDNYPSLQTDYVIYNIMGQIVLQGKLQESAIINIESLVKGMYYLRIANTTVKFVKD